jgi:hypothetical protein
MRLQSVTVSSQAASAAIPLDREANPFSVGLKVVVTGTNTSAVEVTLDDVFNPAVTPTWTALTGLTALTATANGNIAFNCTAVRLNVTAFTNGSATLQVMQGKQG